MPASNVIPDETPTEDLLRLAAIELHSTHVEQESMEAMGKRAWDDILAPHISYLVRDNWCHTAGDAYCSTASVLLTARSRRPSYADCGRAWGVASS